ncbi:MAG TPA: choice-of-anchor D domain-containing protein, partial [Mycobacteriales bacterium]|nr:choice-of-anchor D domain-containing protein [Mycobacteriales bacterium]
MRPLVLLTCRFSVVLLMAGAVPATTAHAASASASATQSGVTSVTMVSEGEYVGAGLSQLFHPGNGSVTAAGSAGAVSVSVSGGTHGKSFSLEFAAPPGEALQVGTYTGVQRSAFREAGRPGIDISGDGRGCNRQAGRFTVFDIAFVGDTLDRLHLVYEQHCEGGEAALFGEVRWRAAGGDAQALVAPGVIAWPDEYPGVRGRPVPVTIVNTSALAITVGTPRITGPGSDSFIVASNACTSPVAAGSSCTVHARFQPTAAGDRRATLEIPADSSRTTWTVGLQGAGETGHTSWQMRGDAGDYISGGRSYSWTPANATISGYGAESFVSIGVQGAEGNWFTAEFAPGRNDVLLPGVTYEGARRYPFHSPAPGLTISGSGRGCNTSTGRFTVHEIVHGPYGLEAFSATFEQHCEGGVPALYGSIALRAASPAQPVPGGTAPPAPKRVDIVTVTGTDGQLWVRDTDRLGWRPYGGRLVGAPAFAWGYYDDYFIGVGADENVWIRSWDQPWRPLGPRGTRCSGASAAVSHTTLAVACRGADGAVWVGKTTTADGRLPQLSRWQSYGGRTKHGVSVADVSEAEGVAAFVYLGVGLDDRPWYRTDSPGWAQLSRSACGDTLATSTYFNAVACRNLGDERLKTFHGPSGTDGALVDGRVVGRPGVSVDPDGLTRYYVLGVDRSIWVATQQADGRLGPFRPFGGAGVGGISVHSVTGYDQSSSSADRSA